MVPVHSFEGPTEDMSRLEFLSYRVHEFPTQLDFNKLDLKCFFPGILQPAVEKSSIIPQF